MEPGLITPNMDTSGFPMLLPGSLLMPRTAIGSILMMGGHGFLIIHGDGLLFIMVAGSPMLPMDPCGFPITNGVRDG